MRRGVAGPYNAAARVWLVAAALSLLLPSTVRLGIWLPVHLALAGAVSVAISGNMQSFAAALSAGPAPGRVVTAVQFLLVNIGALLVAIGIPSRSEPLAAIGGSMFVSGAVLLLAIVLRSWRNGVNRRHGIAIALYAAAVVSLIFGAAIGTLLGVGAISDADTWLGLRRAHPVLNLLGWASLAIVGTFVTFLPTVVRVRMPPRAPVATALLLTAGLIILAGGLAFGLTGLAVIGAISYTGGAFMVLARTIRVVSLPRRHRPPVAAWHLTAASGWYALSCLGLSIAVAVDATLLDRQRAVFLAAFIGGWILQTLLGSWLYLLPSARRGPEPRRLLLAAVERGGPIGLAAWNGGLALLVIGVLLDIRPLVVLGVTSALAGGLFTFGRLMAFPKMSRTAGTEELARRMWG